MKFIYGYDTADTRDFSVVVNDKVYEEMKRFLVQYHLKHPKEVNFLLGGEE